MIKTYHGSCHCQAVKFEVDADLSAGTGKCNCTFCAKARLWCLRVLPEAIRIRSGEDHLGDYSGRNPTTHHLFCKTCGIRPFEYIDPPNPLMTRYYNVNVLCLDDLGVEELVKAPVTFGDGLNNRWSSRPEEIRHL